MGCWRCFNLRNHHKPVQGQIRTGKIEEKGYNRGKESSSLQPLPKRKVLPQKCCKNLWLTVLVESLYVLQDGASYQQLETPAHHFSSIAVHSRALWRTMKLWASQSLLMRTDKITAQVITPNHSAWVEQNPAFCLPRKAIGDRHWLEREQVYVLFLQ